MARGNLFLGQAKGKVGSVVFSRLKGQQITKTYNATPANPKTRAQALQRAQFATVIAASVGFKEVINNTFDGVKNGQDSVNEFVSRNLADIRTRSIAGSTIANDWLTPKGRSLVQPQPWILSKGSLGSIEPSNLQDLLGPFSKLITSEFVDDEPFGVQAKILSNLWKYQPGCQLTFVTITLEVDSQTNQYTLRPRYDRVIFNNLAPAANSDECPIMYEFDDFENGAFIPASYLDMTKTNLPVVNNRVYLPKYFEVLQSGGTADDPSKAILSTAVTDEFGNQVTGLGIICTQIDSNGNYIHSNSVYACNEDTYDYTEDAVATYMASSVNKIRSSDYYTEQPDGGETDGYQEVLMKDVVSSVISADGMSEKGVYLEQSNSYGPVAEGNIVRLAINVASPFSIAVGTVNAYNGENPLGNDWTILRVSSRVYSISGPMPTTASFPLNVSFKVADPRNGSYLGTAALRINISKANS